MANRSRCSEQCAYKLFIAWSPKEIYHWGQLLEFKIMVLELLRLLMLRFPSFPFVLSPILAFLSKTYSLNNASSRSFPLDFDQIQWLIIVSETIRSMHLDSIKLLWCR
jgi:hypothetical protein